MKWDGKCPLCGSSRVKASTCYGTHTCAKGHDFFVRHDNKVVRCSAKGCKSPSNGGPYCYGHDAP